MMNYSLTYGENYILVSMYGMESLEATERYSKNGSVPRSNGFNVIIAKDQKSVIPNWEQEFV